MGGLTVFMSDICLQFFKFKVLGKWSQHICQIVHLISTHGD